MSGWTRRRAVVAGTGLAGGALLGASLSTPPGSTKFYGQTLAVAGVWTLGGLLSGPVRLTSPDRPGVTSRAGLRTAAAAVLLGAGAFGLFYLGALACRHIPPLNRAISKVLNYAHQGSAPLVALTTLANGAGEEVYFRGALYAALGLRRPVEVSTALYVVATTATRNPALVLASVVMGALFAIQRRVTGGILAPMLTHLTWSVLMLRFLPPLFDDPPVT